MGFKENLKEELSYQGLMIKELAAKAGLNQRSVSNYLRENSSIPAADVAVKIARALGVSVEYLVEGYPPPIYSTSTATNKYTPTIRDIAEKLSKMNEHDLAFIQTVINYVCKN